jgi:hypothetical protein
MLREIIREDRLPDYALVEETGDMIRVTPRAAVVEAAAAAFSGAPYPSPEALEEARRLMPGADVYALEAGWREVWTTSGRPALRSVDKAFLGWVRKRQAEG